MTVRITVDAQSIKDIEKRLGSLAKKAPNAISNALNRAVTNINSNIKKEVRSKYHIKAGDIADTLDIRRANVSNLSAHVISKGKVIGLDKFKVSPKTANPKRKAQLKIAVKKEATKQILGAFILNLHGVKVFTRSGEKHYPKQGSYAGKGILREKINRKFGPSVPQMIGNKEVVAKIEKGGQETYQKRLNQEIQYLLSKL